MSSAVLDAGGSGLGSVGVPGGLDSVNGPGDSGLGSIDMRGVIGGAEDVRSMVKGSVGGAGDTSTYLESVTPNPLHLCKNSQKHPQCQIRPECRLHPETEHLQHLQ